MDETSRRFPRRTLLQGMGAAGLLVGVDPRYRRAWTLLVDPATGARLAVSNSALSPSLQVYAYRREDLLNLRFDLYNLELDTSASPPKLVPISTSQASWLVAVLPFQSIAEYSDPVGETGPSSWPNTPVQSLASGPSQLAFTVPTSGIPFTMKALTGWGNLTPLLPAVSTEAGAAPATDPTGAPTSSSPPLTYIEMAWQLLVAPGAGDLWNTSPIPITHTDPVDNQARTELWTATMGVFEPYVPPVVYAVWTPGYVATGSPRTTDPFNTSLTDPAGDNTNRTGLVALSSQARNANHQTINGKPASVRTLMLTPLGATTDIRGTYDSPSVSGIVAWTHQMSVGRDTFVRVILAGYIYPFGNRAVLIETTDREFHGSPSGDTVAYLVDRLTVQITEPVVSYPYPDVGAVAEAYDGRQNPFTSIEFKTLNTPPIDPPGTAGSKGSPNVDLGSPTVSPDTAIWINVDGSPFPFAMTGTDAEGRAIDFKAWGIWVGEGVEETDTNNIAANYNAASATWRTVELQGQLMALAEPAAAAPGATALHVDSLVLDTNPYGMSTWNGSGSGTSPPWYPVVSATEGFRVRLPAVSALTATDGNDSSGTGSQVVYETSAFLPDGFSFPAGTPEVFLTFPSGGGPPALNFSQGGTQSSQTGTSQSGGLVAPNFNIDGFARDKGPVSDTADLLKGKFNPAAFFATLNANILGAVSLADILQSFPPPPSPASEVDGAGQVDGPDDSSSAGDQTPQINSVPIYKKGQRAPVALKTTIDWQPTIMPALDNLFQPGDPNGLTIHVVLHSPLDPPGPPTSVIDGELSNFTLELFGDSAPCIQIHFTNVQFSQRTGAKSTVQVNIDTVTFVGALSFIQSFEELFASLGGPSIDVQPSGITASYTVSLPSIGLGVFALENLSLGGTLNVPFTGQPVRLRVNFCTRENPFLLSIYFFTGGGWFAISLGADGIELVEVGLEFGASISLDLGVASGGVSIMAGIYLALGSDTVNLTGFFQASGNLEVLGIISISIVFYLGFTYQSTPQGASAYGTASVTVTVSVLCFSASVSLTVTKQIYSSDPPIPFDKAITATDWSDYCSAFA